MVTARGGQSRSPTSKRALIALRASAESSLNDGRLPVEKLEFGIAWPIRDAVGEGGAHTIERAPIAAPLLSEVGRR